MDDICILITASPFELDGSGGLTPNPRILVAVADSVDHRPRQVLREWPIPQRINRRKPSPVPHLTDVAHTIMEARAVAEEVAAALGVSLVIAHPELDELAVLVFRRPEEPTK